MGPKHTPGKWRPSRPEWAPLVPKSTAIRLIAEDLLCGADGIRRLRTRGWDLKPCDCGLPGCLGWIADIPAPPIRRENGEE